MKSRNDRDRWQNARTLQDGDVSLIPSRRLIDFLERVSAGLRPHQTVGEQFSHERLTELGSEFNLANGDWNQLYYFLNSLKE